jgi:2-dehydro-3-deoxyphosphooctonate aldolase (KDO 8-P synthase)
MQLELEHLINNEKGNFFLISGPCVVESEEMCFKIARHIKKLTSSLGIPYIFKASYRKANRTRKDSFTGIGDEKALKIIGKIRKELNIPTITDIHNDEDAEMVADYVDAVQIPAFLCRQSSLLEAAAKTGKIINIKKGQFLSHQAMKFPMEKVVQMGNPNVMLTERGNSFGYQDLVVDFIGVQEMQAFCNAVVVDCTHSLQRPNQVSGVTGGKPESIGTMAKCAIASGAQGIFIETHPDPSNALSDGANMLKLDKLESLLVKLVKLKEVINND